MVSAREVRVCLFNMTSGIFVGSTQKFKGRQLGSDSDWVIDGDGAQDNSFFARLADYEPGDRQSNANLENISILFEFVVFFEKKGIELEMSCGWASIPLKDLSRSEER